MYTISKTTPYAIFVSMREKTLKIPGESFVSGYGSPDFVIEKTSQLHWIDADGTKTNINDSELEAILQFVLHTLRERGWDIVIG